MTYIRGYNWTSYFGQANVNDGPTQYILDVGYANIDKWLYIRLFTPDELLITGKYIKNLSRYFEFGISTNMVGIIIDTAKRFEKLKAFI